MRKPTVFSSPPGPLQKTSALPATTTKKALARFPLGAQEIALVQLAEGHSLGELEERVLLEVGKKGQRRPRRGIRRPRPGPQRRGPRTPYCTARPRQLGDVSRRPCFVQRLDRERGGPAALLCALASARA